MPPTVIDSLIVSLGLDPKDFKKGEKEYLKSIKKMEEESTKSNKVMEKGTSDLSDTVGVMTKRVLGLATAMLSVGAAKAFISNITQSDAATGRLAENINSTSEELSLWQGIVKRVGGDSSGVAKSFEGIARSLEQWQLYGTYPDAFKLFAVENISLIDKATGKQRSFTDLMIETSKVMEGMNKAKAHEIGYGMGLDNDLINILQQGPVATMKYITEQRSIISQGSSKEAQERQDAQAKLTASLTELGRNIVNDLSPGIRSLSDNIRKVIDAYNKITSNPLSDIKGIFTPIFIPKTLGDGTLEGNLRPSSSGLGTLIRKLESGNNYGAINTDKSYVKDIKSLKTEFESDYANKSLIKIIAEESTGKYQAAGAYQIRENTLKDAIQSMGLSGDEKFTKEMQDRIFNEFLVPRRIKGNDKDSLNGLINEFDALKGHESETMRLLSGVNQSQNNTTSDNSIHINEVNLTTTATNKEELANDIRSQIGQNYSNTTQAGSAYR